MLPRSTSWRQARWLCWRTIAVYSPLSACMYSFVLDRYRTSRWNSDPVRRDGSGRREIVGHFVMDAVDGARRTA